MCFSFFLNTGCSMCFCIFAKHRMFHVLLFILDVTVAKEHLIKIQAQLVFSPIHSVLTRTHRFRACSGWPARSGVRHSIGNNATRTSRSWPEAGPMQNQRRDVLQPDQMCVRPEEVVVPVYERRFLKFANLCSTTDHVARVLAPLIHSDVKSRSKFWLLESDSLWLEVILIEHKTLVFWPKVFLARDKRNKFRLPKSRKRLDSKNTCSLFTNLLPTRCFQ